MPNIYAQRRAALGGFRPVCGDYVLYGSFRVPSITTATNLITEQKAETKRHDELYMQKPWYRHIFETT